MNEDDDAAEAHRLRILAIEAAADERLAQARAAARSRVHIGSRSVRYRDLLDGIVEMLVADEREAIEAQMRAQVEVAQVEFYRSIGFDV